ncbi:MAG TPA: protein phosphatase 2C domain-containing protein [Micromonosporaceae bacterium]|jgi:protein phosphatase
MRLRSAAFTDIGLGRSNNEDSALAGPRLAVVADGIGGMPNGEQASAVVARQLAMLDPGARPARPLPESTPAAGTGRASGDATLPMDVPTQPLGEPDDPVVALREAVAAANRTIRHLIDLDENTEAMGTTVTALLLAHDQIALLHVGDSRAYLLHGGMFEQVTRDDTYVQTLVDEGLISATQARTHPRRSVVMQAVQGLAYEPTCSLRPATPGDRYMLCSDGLSDVVGDEAIHDALEMEPDPGRCAHMLVRLALQAGAPDNVTVIVADVSHG